MTDDLFELNICSLYALQFEFVLAFGPAGGIHEIND